MGARTIAATLTLLSGALSLEAIHPALAGPAIKTFTPEAVTTDPANTYGFTFYFNTAETVRGLGAYNSGNSGLTGPAQVGLWDASGNLLASTTVPAGIAATLIGNFSYNGITPITLDALTLYYVGSYQPFDPVSSFQASNYGPSPPLDANVGAVTQEYGIGPGLVFPNIPEVADSTAGAYLGANLTDGPIPIAGLPEPATLVILVTSLAALARLRQRTEPA